MAGKVSDRGLDLRLGGATVGEDARADMVAGAARGRLGGETIGKDIALEFVGAELSGRFGGHFAGKDVSLHFDTPPEIALLAAVIGFKALEDNSSRAAAASS